MNEEMQAKVLEWIERGGAFVETEAPQLAAEIVAWHFWSSAITAVAFFAAVVASCLAAHGYGRIYDKAKSEELPPPLLAWIIAVLLSAALFLPLGVLFVGESIKATIAPRVVVVESLGKTMSGQ